MTNEEARAYFIDSNKRIISVAKDENRYNYETQQIEDVFMRRDFEAKEMAIEALGQTMWIPVSQKLPDKYGIYLVTLNNHDTDFCEFYPNDRTFGMNGNVCYEVTAWRELPQPYKAESEVRNETCD